MGELLFPAFHGEERLDMETPRGISTTCFPVTQASCSSAVPSMAGGGNAEFGTDFVVFSASWLSCCLLPSLHVLVEQQPLGPDGARRILFHHAGNSSLMFELVKGGLVTTFSQLFFSSELCRCMSRCSNLRDHLNGTVPTEKRGHMRTGRWCLLTPGHLASTLLQSFEHSLPKSRANGS